MLFTQLCIHFFKDIVSYNKMPVNNKSAIFPPFKNIIHCAEILQKT